MLGISMFSVRYFLLILFLFLFHHLEGAASSAPKCLGRDEACPSRKRGENSHVGHKVSPQTAKNRNKEYKRLARPPEHQPSTFDVGCSMFSPNLFLIHLR